MSGFFFKFWSRQLRCKSRQLGYWVAFSPSSISWKRRQLNTGSSHFFSQLPALNENPGDGDWSHFDLSLMANPWPDQKFWVWKCWGDNILITTCVLSYQTGFLTSKNHFLAWQMTCLRNTSLHALQEKIQQTSIIIFTFTVVKTSLLP